MKALSIRSIYRGRKFVIIYAPIEASCWRFDLIFSKYIIKKTKRSRLLYSDLWQGASCFAHEIITAKVIYHIFAVKRKFNVFSYCSSQCFLSFETRSPYITNAPSFRNISFLYYPKIRSHFFFLLLDAAKRNVKRGPRTIGRNKEKVITEKFHKI